MPRERKKPRRCIGVFTCLTLRPKAPFQFHWLSVRWSERDFRRDSWTRAAAKTRLFLCQERVWLNDTLKCFVFLAQYRPLL